MDKLSQIKSLQAHYNAALRPHRVGQLNFGLPRTKKLVALMGATVTDVDQTDPTDGGTLVNTGHPLFSTISENDINQYSFADCYLLAAIAALAGLKTGQDYLRSIMYYDPKDPTKVVMTYVRNGIVTRIHCSLLVTLIGNQFDQADADIWVQIIEKTYALYRSGADTYNSINYGSSAAVFSDLGCTPTAFAYQQGKTLSDTIKGYLAMGRPMGLDTTLSPGRGLVPNHVYTVLSVNDDGTVNLRNPWGAGYNPVAPLQLGELNTQNFTYLEVGTIPTVQVDPIVAERARIQTAIQDSLETTKANVLAIVKPTKQGDNKMEKADVVAAGVQAIQSAEAQALADQLGIAFDAGLASAPTPASGFTQADLDAAVKAEQTRIAAAVQTEFGAEEARVAAIITPPSA